MICQKQISFFQKNARNCIDNLPSLVLIYTYSMYINTNGGVFMAKGKKQKTRKLGIRNKILIPVLVIMLIVTGAMGTLMYLIGESAYVEAGVEQSHMAASIATTMIDGDSIAGIKAGAETTTLYQKELADLREIKETCGILYMYTIYEENGNLYYGVDTDESEGQCMPGDAYDDDPEPVYVALAGGEFVRDYVVSNEYGNLISSYVPSLFTPF